MADIEPRFRTALDLATDRLRATLTGAIAQAAERLGALAPSARIADRDLMNAAQFELRRNAAALHQAFERSLVEQVAEDLAPKGASRRSLAAADWQSLSLVDDREVEDRMAADRLGQQLVQDADEALGEVERLLGALRPRPAPGDPAGTAAERNPLRGEVLGTALHQALKVATHEVDVRRVVARELGAALQKAMPACLAAIRDDLRGRGVQPVEPALRGVDGPGHHLPGVNSAYQTIDDLRSQHGTGEIVAHSTIGGTGGYIDPEAATRLAAFLGSTSGANAGPFGAPTSDPSAPGSRYASTRSDGRPGGTGLTAQLRQWTALAHGDTAGGRSVAGRRVGDPPASRRGGGTAFGIAPQGAEATGGGTYPGTGGLMAVNLIHAHREELRQLADGRLDRMVIDLIGGLFDQILSDTRVPPQMARQIARLQLPVLRVALVDSSFFSSRRHPVRRFVNRIASLACAFDEFDDGPGRLFLERVQALVEEIVDGDFDQIELYASKLEALERQTADATQQEVAQRGAVATLGAKENELRLQQRYVLQLQAALKPLDLPAWLGGFLAEVWSQALVVAATRDGHDGERTQRFRRVGRDLVLSVQPKGSMPLRKRFLMQLPGLMKDLNEGLAAIGWPESAQREFMSRLLPAHAESLKTPPLSELEHNLLAKRLEQVFSTPMPGQDSLTPADPVPDVAPEVLEHRFTPEEAARIGLVTERSVDWNGVVDIDLADGVATRGDGAAVADGSGVVSAAYRPTEPADLDAVRGDDGAGVSGIRPPRPGRPREAVSAFDRITATPRAPGLDIDLGDSGAGVSIGAGGRPASPSSVRGAPLIEHLKLGFAYRMLLKDEWQKVRLAHVSAGRSFFVFTLGRRHQETISMTARMLGRMCESGRFRVVENQYLVDRATQRARQQLAAIGST